MPHLSLRLTAGLVTTACLACDTTGGPVAPGSMSADRAASLVSLPYATGVHLAGLARLEYAYTLHPLALNDWGEVVGTWDAGARGGSTGPVYAFKWQATRGLHVLFLPGSPETEATGVNNSGQVAITIDSGAGRSAAIWSWFDQIKRLRDLSSYRTATVYPDCVSGPINNQGILLGSCTWIGLGCAAPNAPTLWTTFGSPFPFKVDDEPSLKGGIAAPGFSDAGLSAGSMFDSCHSLDFVNPFVFDGVNREFRLIQHLAIGNTVVPTWAVAINNNGHVVGNGQSTQPGCAFHPAVWLDSHAAPLDLGFCGTAAAISDDDVVVGTYSFGDSSFAFVWTPATGARRLPHFYPMIRLPGQQLSHETSTAFAINRRHQIVGAATSHALPDVPLAAAVMWTLPAQ